MVVTGLPGREQRAPFQGAGAFSGSAAAPALFSGLNHLIPCPMCLSLPPAMVILVRIQLHQLLKRSV